MFEVDPIGIIHTPFEQKLGIPRQPGLAKSVESTIVLRKELAKEEVLRGLESFDYLWLIYWCHKSESWRETIRPPRLGGKTKLGFLATRSPHRPNPLGLSVVKLKSINDDFSITVTGADILDQTPLIDLKPYLSMWDSHSEASNGWVDETPKLEAIDVRISDEASSGFEKLDSYTQQIIRETLCWDPRPAYTKDLSRSFIHNVNGVEVTWKRENDHVMVLQVVQTVKK